jgi:DNA gyrase subunit B
MFDLGMIYIADLPLYQAEDKHKGKQLGFTLKEIQSKVAAGTHITRFKGLGECNNDQLNPMAFDPEQRKLIQINPLKNKKEFDRYMALVGESVIERKKLLGLI